jgi:hypothetical protein
VFGSVCGRPFLVGLPDFMPGILNGRAVDAGSPSPSAGGHGRKTSPSPQKCQFAEVAPYHSIHLVVMSVLFWNFTLTVNLTQL